MHYHLEVIMPKSKNIEKDLESIMMPFSENDKDNEDHSGHSFWDFYVIGGRWAGTKETCQYDADKLEQFYIEINKRGVTVSGIRSGKQELSPASQIPMVDALWCEYFPTQDGSIVPCPIFKHSNNQYDSSDFIGCDICSVESIPDTLKSSRVIVAGPYYDDSKMVAHYMISDDFWNGVNHIDTTWDGNVLKAIEMAKDKFKNYTEEAQLKYTPQPDWLCITVDYHS